MKAIPVLLDGDHDKLVGNLFLDDKIVAEYEDKKTYAVLNPNLKVGEQDELVSFSLYLIEEE